jgi:hypothetical protein
VAFESEEAMKEHKAAHGRTQVMVAPLADVNSGGRARGGDAGPGWRVEKGDFSKAGFAATK